jgi:hypothetical protein
VFSLTVSRPVKESVDEDAIILIWNTARSNAYDRRTTRWRYSLWEAFSPKDPERLRLPPDITPALESFPEASSEPTELPASTAPVGVAQGRSRHSRKPNTFYIDGQRE